MKKEYVAPECCSLQYAFAEEVASGDFGDFELEMFSLMPFAL